MPQKRPLLATECSRKRAVRRFNRERRLRGIDDLKEQISRQPLTISRGVGVGEPTSTFSDWRLAASG
jgi:hypothetical protein